MLARSVTALMLLGSLSLASTASAQGASTGDSVVDPAVKLRALETMNSAASSKLADALKHEAELRDYAKSQGLSEDCGGSPETSGGHDMAMGFEQALQVAIDHEQSAPSGHDTTATSGEIRAYTTLARSTWDKLQSAMANVEHLSDCLHESDKFNDYVSWSGQQQTAHQKEMEARNADVSKQRGQEKAEVEQKEQSQYEAFKAAQKAQHEQFLKQSWTKYKFDQQNDLKAYKYRTEYGPNSYYNTYAGSIYGGGGYGGYGY